MSTQKTNATTAPKAEVKPAAPAELPSPVTRKTVAPASVSSASKTATKPATQAASKAPRKAKPAAKPVTQTAAPAAAKQPLASAKADPKANSKSIAQPDTPAAKRKTAATEKVKAVKEKKVKVVRDSFTIPKTEFEQLAVMKKRATALGMDIKKSELIRAGLQMLAAMQDAVFIKALAAVPIIKTGRPSKG